MMLLDRGELMWEGLVEYIIFCWITGSRNNPQNRRMLCCFVADMISASNSLILGDTTSGGGSSFYFKRKQVRLLKSRAEECKPKGTTFLQLPLPGSAGCSGSLCPLMDLAITLLLPVTVVTNSKSFQSALANS